MKFVDLCCGIGSFHYSFKKQEWECVMACDINKSARTTYLKNYNIEPYGDLYDIDMKSIPAFDILCAGFPCQPFSNAGFHKGFEDTRGILFFEIMKWVQYHNPKFVILENVSAIISHDSGNTLKTIYSMLEKAGYKVSHKILKCSDYGIPQMRKRVFIVASKCTTNPEEILSVDEYKSSTTLSSYLGQNFAKDVAYTIRCGGRRSPILDKHNWDGYFVDGKEYRLTIDDALKLQGYDSSFVLCGSEADKWKQLGNTIPTIFTDIIAKNLSKHQ
jgi:DNA (cytosine-5)-methyltransferase 1